VLESHGLGGVGLHSIHSPTGHMIAMKQLLRYLAGTVDWKLRVGSHGDGPKDEYSHVR